jgi:transposase
MLNIMNANIWFYREPVDFRKQINGLVLLLAGDLERNPGNGDVYIFRSKGAKSLKILLWESNGFWLLYRKLDTGRFRFPTKEDEILEISKAQLSWLLSGLDIQKLKEHKQLFPARFH